MSDRYGLDLAVLTRPELDMLISETEHAVDRAHIALRLAPMIEEQLIGACGVAQDCHALMMDCYDESMLRLGAEFDRMLGGDGGI